ncbi:hypothetical protein XENOCAPTIV_023477 [Xenoophorus captivus]|uniref:Uncharacterized protein n=1 Tax=Xenoophorus captivus TaxID=1517983 RepID=A0ABV0SA21_9TELE
MCGRDCFKLESYGLLTSWLPASHPAPLYTAAVAQTIAPITQLSELASPHDEPEVNVVGHKRAKAPQPCGNYGRRVLYGRPSIGHGPSSSVLSMRQDDRTKRGMKQRFDRKHRVKRPTLMTSDWVRIMRPHQSHKMLLFWSAPQKTAPSGMLAG